VLVALALGLALIAGLMSGKGTRRGERSNIAQSLGSLTLLPPEATADGGILLRWSTGAASASYVVIFAGEDKVELKRFGPVSASELRLDPADLPRTAGAVLWRVVGLRGSEPVEASEPAEYRSP
jgi:hypothetical protein